MKIRLPSKKTILIYAFIIPIFEPKLFTQYSVTEILYIALNLSELLYFIINYSVGSKSHRSIHRPILAWIALQIYLLLSMLINNNMGGILQWGYLSVMVCNLIFLCEISFKNHMKLLLNIMATYGTLLLIINYITVLIFKDGIIAPELYYMEDNATYFLGIKTAFTTMMFPTIASAGALYLMEKSKKNFKNLLIAVSACILNIASKMISTAIVGCVIIITMLLISKLTKKRISTPLLYCIALASQIAVVFFNMQNAFSKLFEVYFHKDASLSSRTYIWEQAKELIGSKNIFNLLFGNGIVKQHMFVPYSGGHWQPHDQLLVWIYTGGIVGIIIIIFFFLMLAKWKRQKNEVYYYLSIVSFTVLFLSITEVYFDVAICYVPFLLLYYIGKYYEINKDNICFLLY